MSHDGKAVATHIFCNLVIILMRAISFESTEVFWPILEELGYYFFHRKDLPNFEVGKIEPGCPGHEKLTDLTKFLHKRNIWLPKEKIRFKYNLKIYSTLKI